MKESDWRHRAWKDKKEMRRLRALTIQLYEIARNSGARIPPGLHAKIRALRMVDDILTTR